MIGKEKLVRLNAKITWGNTQCSQLRKELEEAHNGQTLLIEKLIQCCNDVRRHPPLSFSITLLTSRICEHPDSERTKRLFTSLLEELEKRGTKVGDMVAGG